MSFRRAVSFCVCLLCLATLLVPVQLAAKEYNLNADQAKEFIADTPHLFLLDVRTEKEFAEKRLPGAVNIPIDELKARASELPADAPILIYCRSGRRAKIAADLLEKIRTDLKEVYVLDDYPHY